MTISSSSFRRAGERERERNGGLRGQGQATPEEAVTQELQEM